MWVSSLFDWVCPYWVSRYSLYSVSLTWYQEDPRPCSILIAQASYLAQASEYFISVTEAFQISIDLHINHTSRTSENQSGCEKLIPSSKFSCYTLKCYLRSEWIDVRRFIRYSIFRKYKRPHVHVYKMRTPSEMHLSLNNSVPASWESRWSLQQQLKKQLSKNIPLNYRMVFCYAKSLKNRSNIIFPPLLGTCTKKINTNHCDAELPRYLPALKHIRVRCPLARGFTIKRRWHEIALCPQKVPWGGEKMASRDKAWDLSISRQIVKTNFPGVNHLVICAKLLPSIRSQKLSCEKTCIM